MGVRFLSGFRLTPKSLWLLLLLLSLKVLTGNMATRTAPNMAHNQCTQEADQEEEVAAFLISGILRLLRPHLLLKASELLVRRRSLCAPTT